MNRFLLWLFLSFFVSLNAKELTLAKIKCLISKEILFQIDSKKLDLSEDAIIDNTGGYVDIPADKYYIKTKNRLFYLGGSVIIDHTINTSQYNFIIKNDNGKYLDKEELYSFKNMKSLKFIQKIDLEKNNTARRVKNITTTNILDIYFDKKFLEKEYQLCL